MFERHWRAVLAGIEESSNALVGAGWVAHGFWDAIHHEHHGPTEVKTWYPPFCATADFVVGIPLIAKET